MTDVTAETVVSVEMAVIVVTAVTDEMDVTAMTDVKVVAVEMANHGCDS